MATTASFCVKTKGMNTGKDGKYHFPVEKLDGRSPNGTNAIKTGYFIAKRKLPDPATWKRQDAQVYGGRDIFLKKQDPSDVDWHLSDGEEVCKEAPTLEAAAAGVAFTKLLLAEYIRFKAPEQGIRAAESIIRRFESLPSETAAKK